MSSDLLTTGQAATLVGVTINTIKNWIQRGRIRGVRLPSGHFRIPRSEIDRIVGGNSRGEAARGRADSWRRYERWRRTQPVEPVEPEHVLEWNDRMLEIARSRGSIPEESPQEKADRLRATRDILGRIK